MEQTFCFTLNSSALLFHQNPHLGNHPLSVHCSHLDTRNPSLPVKQKAFFYLQRTENKTARTEIEACQFLPEDLRSMTFSYKFKPKEHPISFRQNNNYTCNEQLVSLFSFFFVFLLIFLNLFFSPFFLCITIIFSISVNL